MGWASEIFLGIRRIFADGEPLPARGAINFVGAVVTDNPDEDRIDVDATGGGGGGVPTTRTLTAGLGLTGGGSLAADRTINVGANGDGSILANANDIQVGILATDAQHGVRGGGTQHAAANSGTAGFMSAADKVILDAATASAGASLIVKRGTDGAITVGTAGQTIELKPYAVTTTTATATEIIRRAIVANESLEIDLTVIADWPTDPGGASRAFFRRNIRKYRLASAAAVEQATAPLVDPESEPVTALLVTDYLDVNDLVVKVTGASGSMIKWHASAIIRSFIAP